MVAAGVRGQLTARRLAQAGIVAELLAAARSLAEIYRLRAVDPGLTLQAAMVWITAALLALAFLLISLLLLFAGRDRLAGAVALVMVVAMIAYKAAFVGLG